MGTLIVNGLRNDLFFQNEDEEMKELNEEPT